MVEVVFPVPPGAELESLERAVVASLALPVLADPDEEDEDEAALVLGTAAVATAKRSPVALVAIPGVEDTDELRESRVSSDLGSGLL